MTLTFVDTRTGQPADISEYGLTGAKGCVVPSYIRAIDAETGLPVDASGYGQFGGGMGSATALFIFGGLAVAAYGASRRQWPLASFGVALAIFGQGASA